MNPISSEEAASDNAQAAQYGYSSAEAFQRGLADFVHAHRWAVRAIALVHRQIWAEAERDEPCPELPRLYNVQLACLSKPNTSSKDRNPATSFKLLEIYPRRLDDFIQLYSESWEQSTTLRQAHEERFSQIPGYQEMVMIQYDVQDTVFSYVDFVPVYAHTPCTEGTRAARRLIMEDMAFLCMSSINCGFPLWIVAPEYVVALPGRYVRDQGCWKWIPLVNDWDEYVPGKPGEANIGYLDQALSILGSGLTVPQLMHACLRICGR